MNDNNDLLAALESLQGAKVLCLGDVMLDSFQRGQVTRISPEAPIPVFSFESEEIMLGGAGNVMRNLAGLGASVSFVSAIGDDEAGREVRALTQAEKTTSARIISDEDRRTSIKTRYVAGTQQMMRADRESLHPLAPGLRDSVLKAAGEAMEDCAAVVVSDYGKGFFANGLAARVIEMANDKNLPVIVDPQGSDYAIYAGATLVTPNRKELSDATRLPATDDGQVEAAARALIQAHGFGHVLATRSAQGMSLIRAGGEVHHLAADAQEVFDVSGAGDTVVAVLAASMAAGMALPQAAALANLAGGLVVGKLGTAVIRAEDLALHLRHDQMARSESKILSAEEGLVRVTAWRRQGQKICFTNGCFDLLHPGHLSLLEQARGAGDRLVVGLNGDQSVKRLKGDSRPVQGEAARAQVLASLEGVDMVIIFTDDTPVRLIEAIRPEFFVKGADYRIEEIPEARIVKGYGGKVLLAQLAEGHSTTATIERLAK